MVYLLAQNTSTNCNSSYLTAQTHKYLFALYGIKKAWFLVIQPHS